MSEDHEMAVPTAQAGFQQHRPRDTVVLRVGDERFTVRKSSLANESRFFEALFSSKWSQAEADGSYSIDCDPEPFKHVLRYCRIGLFPLCLTPEKEHDLVQYAEIMATADYLGVEELVGWLREEMYLEALTTMLDLTFDHVLFETDNTPRRITATCTDVKAELREHKYTKIICMPCGEARGIDERRIAPVVSCDHKEPEYGDVVHDVIANVLTVTERRARVNDKFLLKRSALSRQESGFCHPGAVISNWE